MQRILSVDNMRDSDAATIKAGIPGRELMYRAGVAILKATEERINLEAPVAIVAGSGNNAGDGYVIALLLWERGVECRLFILKDKFSEDGAHFYEMCKDRGIAATFVDGKKPDFSGFKIIYDCIYGTGFHGSVGEPVDSVINAINEAGQEGSYVVSVDINSGLNGQNGMTELSVKSDLTVSVGDYQPGHFLNYAKDYIKEKTNCPIGIEPVRRPLFLYEGEDAAQCLPERKNFSNKGTYGYVALIGGCVNYSGAIRLASMAENNVEEAARSFANLGNASMRSGAGVATVAVPSSIVPIVATKVLESTIYPLSEKNGALCFSGKEMDELIKGRKTVAFGMGVGKSEETKNILKYLLETYTGTLIVDADGLNCLAETEAGLIKNTTARLVLTPHIKEFSRLTGKSIADIQASPIESAAEYAGKTGAIVLLKGPSTIVTDGEEVLLVEKGCPGMATAGSGDVLSGILAAVCSFNKDNLLYATAAGAYINGLAGEIAQRKKGAVSMIASDTVEAIAEAVNSIC